MFISRPTGQRGDTIVEVLISIAIVSLVLGGAYVTTNHSLMATRAAQEQATALKIAQGQLEQVKGLAASDPSALFAPMTLSPFCISDTGTLVPDSDPSCATGTAEPVYHASIVRSANDFTLTESWLDVGGKVTDQLQLNYRVYQ